MSITVSLTDLLKTTTGQQEPMQFADGSPLECLLKLVTQVPALHKWFYDEHEKLKPQVWLMVNGERIYEDEFSEPLSDGDQLLIMVAILGG
ncbi:MAG: MoaD/ThiS family protein [Chloroflexi bacterium]|jgi:hypothetical protein|nr:MoaD/ThiS family protein [Chloroflexota bacterium]